MKSKFLKSLLIPTLSLTTLATSCIALASCNNSNAYSVTYGSTQHLTWTSKPSSATKSTIFIARFNVTVGYAIDEDASDVLVNNVSVKNEQNVLYNNGVVSIPASLVTGNITINLVTRTSVVEYHTVTLNANGGKFSDGSDTKTINNVYTLTKSLLPDPYRDKEGDKTYSFYGWYTDSTLATPVTYGSVLTADVTYYAKWVAETTEVGAHTESSNITVTQTGNIVTCEVGVATTNVESKITLTGNWTNVQFKFIPTAEDATVNVVLNNAVIKSNVNTCPFLFTIGTNEEEFKTITITSSGELNCIYDGRASASTTASDTSSGAVTVDAGDLILDGTSVLKINDQTNYPGYSQALEVDGTLTIQNLTMYCYAYDTVMRGKKAVTLNSGNITCYSKIGDGIKTKNTKLKSGVRNGTITITGNTNLELSVGGDAIDAAYDAIITADNDGNVPNITIATGTNSNYTDTTKAKAAIDKQDMYLRTTETYSQGNNYYSVGFSNDNTLDPLTAEFEEEEIPNIKKITSASQPGPGPGPGPRENEDVYAYYNCDRPYGYKYAYLIKRDNTGTAVAASSAFTIPTGAVTQDSSEKNCATFSVSGSTLSVNSYSNWGNYKTLIGGEVVTKEGLTAWGSKGIKADNSITIKAGIININASDDAIKAKGGVVLGTDKSFGFSTGNVTVDGGQINIACADDGIHSDNTLVISGGTITITAAYEGIEGGKINISGGYTTVMCTDDAMNAAEVGAVTQENLEINVTGGTLDLTAYGQDVDGIDSNNGYTQSGGLVITRGTNGTSFDLNGSGNVTSTGILVCIGKVESTPTSSYSYTLSSGTCSQGSHTITGLTSDTIEFYNKYSFGSGVKVFTGTKATGTPKLN